VVAGRRYGSALGGGFLYLRGGRCLGEKGWWGCAGHASSATYQFFFFFFGLGWGNKGLFLYFYFLFFIFYFIGEKVGVRCMGNGVFL
jgi:hypothetical protein